MKFCVVTFLLLFKLANAQTWHSFQGYEYLIVYSPYVNSYTEAKTGCAVMSATVANVKTTEFQNFLVGKIGALIEFPFSFYIGATRIGNTNLFQWTDGTSVDVGQWAGGEPNNGNGNEDCVTMGWLHELDPLYKWADVPCSYSSRYICQRKIPGTAMTTISLTTSPVRTATTSSKRTFAISNEINTSSMLGGNTIESSTTTASELTQTTNTLHHVKSSSQSQAFSASQTSDTPMSETSTPKTEFSSFQQSVPTEAEQISALVTSFAIIGFLILTNVLSLVVIGKLYTQLKCQLPSKSETALEPTPARETAYEIPMPAPFHNYEDVYVSTANNNVVSYINVNVDHQTRNARNEASYIEFSPKL